jgi:hypothetical protein
VPLKSTSPSSSSSSSSKDGDNMGSKEIPPYSSPHEDPMKG